MTGIDRIVDYNDMCYVLYSYELLESHYNYFLAMLLLYCIHHTWHLSSNTP